MGGGGGGISACVGGGGAHMGALTKIHEIFPCFHAIRSKPFQQVELLRGAQVVTYTTESTRFRDISTPSFISRRQSVATTNYTLARKS